MSRSLSLRARTGVFTGLLLILSFSSVPAQEAVESPPSADVEFYLQEVEPLFAKHCYQCHGEGKTKGGLTLFTRSGLLRGGDSGPAIDVESAASDSMLMQALNYETYEMPPSGKLPQAERDLIARWIEMGAPMPERADIQTEEHGPPQVNEETKSHWAFQPVQKPEIPELDSPWVRNGVDAFILQSLNDAGLEPNPPADRIALVRRLYYDLLGLPPTPEQVQAFLDDTAPDAYENLVDRLLDSPHYGEHWARYWLDLVRYAESNSFERDNPKPFAWKYRDYVIRSLNNDKPYDRFLIEQLAGDELPEFDKDAHIATGFYRLGPWDDEPADNVLARFDEFDDIISTTSQGFLGLTLNCSRCHDHKLDPLPQADYYRFLSFFRNILPYGERQGAKIEENSVRSVATAEELAAIRTELDEHHAALASLRKTLDEIEARVQEFLVGGEKDDFKVDTVRPYLVAKYKDKLTGEQDHETYSRTYKEWSRRKNNPPDRSEHALCVKERGASPLPTHVLIRGNPGAEGDLVEPAFPEVLSPPDPEIIPPAHGASPGRRLALAKWIASPDNPLTARVMANRIWQWHFDRGIVRTASDFGLQGDAPTHPELLDWLAAQFVEQGWSVKTLHRLILTSNAYRMSSAPNAASYEKDPNNDLFWRVGMRRLRAEEVRDSILAVNGTLKLDTMFGPSIYPVIPEAVLAGQSRPGDNWHVSKPEDRTRRSVYIHVKRSLQVPLLASFDVADTDFTCPIRFATTQPTQALGMLNSDFINEQAEIFAKDLKEQCGDDLDVQVRSALTRTMQRTPTEAECQQGLDLIASLQRDHGQSPDAALKTFCLMALNLNEFVYLD